MTPFNKGKFGRRNFGDRDERRSSMHHATCSDCGKSCEVPFKPSGGKPVFCSDCFRGKEGNSDRSERRSFGNNRDFGGRSSYEDRPMYEATCAECGQSCEVPFRPSGNKPVFCSECFKGSTRDQGGRGGRSNDNNSEKFDLLNAKLDRIIREIEAMKQKKSFSPEKQGKMPEQNATKKEIKESEVKAKQPVEKKGEKKAEKKVEKKAEKKVEKKEVTSKEPVEKKVAKGKKKSVK